MMTRLIDRPLPNPWPRRPPKDAHCDGRVECPTPEECAEAWRTMVDPGGSIHQHKCTKPATETLWWGFEAWLCDEHAAKYEERGWAKRNPRRKL